MLEEEKIRLDKWLWAARFFKTRALASQAVNGGKVHLNGQRIKPSRAVKIDDCYQISRGYERIEVVVTGLSGKRGSATVAQSLYKETEESLSQRQREADKRKLAAMQRPSSDHKPNKQERRKIRQFIEKN
ncbi:MAG: S4 domain-containing protein [Gammaproteobacteria bacterium]|nr:S4 domain-containing protein [Gammaproteobacteria bacterium]